MVEQPYHFAVVGDVHGHFFQMIEMLSRWETSTGQSLRYVLQVGDIEPHRHREDADSMDTPEKYRKAGDFRFFFRGEATFPWPVFFIAGNHEPHAWLEQFPQGAELIPGFTYLGRSGRAVLPGGLVVAGVSGIYREQVWLEGRPQWTPDLPMPCKDLIGFTRADMDRLLESLADSPDILLFHDWPAGILEEEGVATETIGNQPARAFVDALQPRFVFCGHMHRKHRATLTHRAGNITEVACMAAVIQGWKSIAIYEVNDGVIREVDATRKD